MPEYDWNRNLILPPDYRRWILAGSSLGLSYSESPRNQKMFNTTLVEPSAYRHFVETGTFREGTMLALILQGIGTNATPALQGQFAHAARDNVFMQFYGLLNEAMPRR